MTSKFSKTDEKDFLLGYFKFTSQIRIKALDILNKQLKSAVTYDEKQSLYILALEQMFFIYEAYEGFYRAFRDRNKVPFLDSIAKDLNVQNIGETLINKSEKKILAELDYNLTAISPEQKSLVESRLLGITGMWRQEKFVEAMKTMFIPMFCAIKHKLMVFKKENQIIFVLEDEKEKKVEDLLTKYAIVPESNISSFDNVLDIAKRLNLAIKDLIALRLFELGIKPTELID